MLLRTWTVSIVPGRENDLEDFARQVSLPMMREQPGCLAAFFTRTATHCLTLTIWASQAQIDAMECNAAYRQVVQQIEASGIVGADHRTQVHDLYAGFIASAGLAAHLGWPVPPAGEPRPGEAGTP